jgi:hypothetical protein
MVSESKDSGTPVADPASSGQQADGGNTRTKTFDSTKQGQWPRRDSGNRNNKNSSSFKKPTPHHIIKFEGRCAELKGELYDCSDVRQVDGYTKMTKEITKYVGQVYSGDAWTAVKSLALLVFTYPSDQATGATETERRKWQKRVDSTVVKDDWFEEDMKKVYSLIWGQCTESLRAKLEAVGGYLLMKTHYDTIDLLKSIKDCVCWNICWIIICRIMRKLVRLARLTRRR